MNRKLNLMYSGFGKLLLKTVSTDSNWYIDFRGSQTQDFDWVMVDNVTKQKITQGTVDAANHKIIVDLSASSGDSSLYIDVDDTGNGVNNLWGWYTDKQITWLDIDVLPELGVMWMRSYPTTPMYIKSEKTNKLVYITLYKSNIDNTDFLNNSVDTLEITNFYGSTYFHNGVFEVSRASKLAYLSIQAGIYFDSFNFKLNNPLLIYVKLGGIYTNNNYVDIQINDNTTYLFLNAFKFRVPLLATQNLPNLSSLTLSTNANETYDINAIVNNLPALEYLQFSRMKTIADINIDGHQHLNHIYFRQLSGLNSITINNCPSLTFFEHYNNILTSLNITNSGALNKFKSYGNSNHIVNIDTLSKQNLENVIINFDSVSEWDFSDAPNLKSISWEYGHFNKFNIKNSNNVALTSVSNHTQYNDATFLVDDPTLPIFQNAQFRAGDVLTSDQTTYDNA